MEKHVHGSVSFSRYSQEGPLHRWLMEVTKVKKKSMFSSRTGLANPAQALHGAALSINAYLRISGIILVFAPMEFRIDGQLKPDGWSSAE